ncbi:MAG: hypothetical protein ABI551_19055 [Polyangiaceae bacterium]
MSLLSLLQPEVEHASRIPWEQPDLAPYFRGLVAADLAEDIALTPCTLLVPNQTAWKQLPLPLDRLLWDPAFVETRFDFFEHTVIPGIHCAHRRRRSVHTLQGGEIMLGDSRVVGWRGAGNVVRSLMTNGLLVHVVDALVHSGSMTP